MSTPTILARAAGGQHIPDKRTVYARLRGLDDGLPPITSYRLHTGPDHLLWRRGSATVGVPTPTRGTTAPPPRKKRRMIIDSDDDTDQDPSTRTDPT